MFILNKPFQYYLSLSVWFVFVRFVYLYHFYQHYLIICVSQEEASLIASNQQIYDLLVNNF